MPKFLQDAYEQEMLAAIDLGSNALRAIVAKKRGSTLEVVKNIRFPLRLGEEVFNTGKISSTKIEITENAFILLLHTFMEFNVTQAQAMATSAMRDAHNGHLLAKRIQKTTGIKIETIDGEEEARLIFNAVQGQIPLKKKTALLMDIGGGSTELIAVKNGKILGVHSFNVGTVRLIQLSQVQLERKIKKEILQMLKFTKKYFGKKKPDYFIGTGGNLRRIGKIRKKILGKPTSQLAVFDEVEHMEEAILSMSFVDRIRRLELDQNRADVILPAIMLTHHLMKALKLNRILLPKVGLKEGIILSMLDVAPKKFILKD